MNRYFIIKQTYAIVGTTYKAHRNKSENAIRRYCKKHNNCEIIFASESINAFISKMVELKAQGISVY